MSIFPRPLKKVLGKIIPFSKEDKVPTFNLGDGVADGTTFLRGDGTWASPGSSGYVPYIGATQDVDLGIYRLIADAVAFDLNPVNGPGAGQIVYDGASGALSYLLNSSNVVSRIGQTMHAYVHNAEAVTITKGQAVYLFSASGNKASVKLASNTSDATSAKTFGLAAENIGAGQNGMVICQGVLDGLNTGMYTAGDILYLGSTPGSYTTIKTYAPSHFVYIGIVERANAGNGQIYVRVQNGYELDEIHDVDLITTPPVNGNVLTYNGSLWVPQAPGGGGLTVGTTSIASGTVGRILFQNGGNVLGQDSALFWDNTNKRLGIGATPSTSVRLDVRAQGALSTDIGFRVRNSADTENIFNVLGTGKTQLCKFGNGQAFAIPNTAGADGFILTTEDASVNAASFTRSHIFMTSTYIDIRAAEGGNARHVLQFSAENYGGTYRNWSLTNASLNDGALYFGVNGTTNRRMFLTNSATLNIGQDSMLNVQSGTNQLRILNGTAPTSLAADTFALYSADRGGTAGRASAHFRSEDGTINVLGDLSGIGTSTPGARLDVRAQGALSTDIAFRVRNSADTADIFTANGDGTQNWFRPANNQLSTIKSGTYNFIQWSNEAFQNIAIGYSTSNLFTPTNYGNTLLGSETIIGSTTGGAVRIGTFGTTNGMFPINIGYGGRVNGTNTTKIGYHTGASSFGGSNSIHIGTTTSGNDVTPDNVFMTYFNSQSSSTLTRSNGSFGLLGQQSYIITNGTGIYGTDTHMGNGGNTLVIRNHTSIPSTNVTDSFQQYSADRGGTAGRASAHFRSEDGTINVLGDLSGIGTSTPGARLDVRAQGALSTDIAFRVRNSADTANLYSIDGLGNVIFNASSGANPFIWNHAGTLQMKLEVAGNSGLLRVYNNGVLRHDIDGRDYASFKGIKINGVGGGVNFLNIGSAVSNSKFNVDIAGDPILDVFNSTNLNVIRFDSRGGEGAIQVRTVSSPTTSIIDGFKQYSADIVAGNAAPHFRTENGNIIKLFTGAALTASDGTLANAVTRIAELEARLQAHGLIA